MPATTPLDFADSSEAACTARLASVRAMVSARESDARSNTDWTRFFSSGIDSPWVTIPATNSSRSFESAVVRSSEVVAFVAWRN